MTSRGEYDPDRDDPQECDLEDEGSADDEETIICPACGRRFIGLIECCPGCGYWVQEDSSAGQRSAGWKWPIMVALLVAMILVVWHGLGR